MVPLHDILCRIIENDHCYFSPPTNIHIKYPCIIYDYSNNLDNFADNRRYKAMKRYTITVIDRNPDSKIPEKLSCFNYLSMDRCYMAEGLWHYVYSLYWGGSRIKENINEESNV